MSPFYPPEINDQMVTQSAPKVCSGKMKSRLSSKYRPITLEYPSDLYLRKWIEPYKERVTSVPRNIYFKFWNKREVVKGRFVGDIFRECLRHWVYCVKRPGWLHKKGSRCADTHSDCDERSYEFCTCLWCPSKFVKAHIVHVEATRTWVNTKTKNWTHNTLTPFYVFFLPYAFFALQFLMNLEDKQLTEAQKPGAEAGFTFAQRPIMELGCPTRALRLGLPQGAADLNFGSVEEARRFLDGTRQTLRQLQDTLQGHVDSYEGGLFTCSAGCHTKGTWVVLIWAYLGMREKKGDLSRFEPPQDRVAAHTKELIPVELVEKVVQASQSGLAYIEHGCGDICTAGYCNTASASETARRLLQEIQQNVKDLCLLSRKPEFLERNAILEELRLAREIWERGQEFWVRISSQVHFIRATEQQLEGQRLRVRAYGGTPLLTYQTLPEALATAFKTTVEEFSQSFGLGKRFENLVKKRPMPDLRNSRRHPFTHEVATTNQPLPPRAEAEDTPALAPPIQELPIRRETSATQEQSPMNLTTTRDETESNKDATNPVPHPPESDDQISREQPRDVIQNSPPREAEPAREKRATTSTPRGETKQDPPDSTGSKQKKGSRKEKAQKENRVPTFMKGSTSLQDYLLGQPYVDLDLWQGRNLLQMEYKDWLSAKKLNGFFGNWNSDGVWMPTSQVGGGILQEYPFPGQTDLVIYQGVNFLRLPGQMLVEIQRVTNQAMGGNAGYSPQGLLVMMGYWLRFIQKSVGSYQEPLKCELCPPKYSHAILYSYQSTVIHLKQAHQIEAEECLKKQSRDFHDNKGYIQKEIGKDWEAVAIRIKRRLDDRLGVGAKESDGRMHQKRDRISRQKKGAEADSNIGSKRAKADSSQGDTQLRRHSIPRRAQRKEETVRATSPFPPDLKRKAQVKLTRLRLQAEGEAEDDLWARHQERAGSRNSCVGLSCEVPATMETPQTAEAAINPSLGFEGMPPDDIRSYCSTSGSQGSFGDF